ncbi:MAG: hypothetical protein C4K47_08725 [Candidatus Thorarchaeota archaeon]|nr:MAG: hypothetical protein C4K47_08725 [Candidatus Thorarchaeota archaeon]
MRKQWFALMLLVVPLMPVAVILSMASPASAWGLATHQFIATEAIGSITNASWASAFDYYTPEIMEGSTTPDTTWQDWDNHLYYPETGQYTAPQAATRWFNFARDNFTAGNWESGFFAAGVMLHYSSDPCTPTHTGPNSTAHAAYERDTNDNLDSLSLTTPSETYIPNVTELVVQSATFAHQYYDIVVEAYPSSDSRMIATNATIKALTEACVSRAINATLSLFHTLTLGINAPDVSYAFEYVALIDYAHSNDYATGAQLNAVNATLARAGFEMRIQYAAINATSLADVDLLIATCALNAYSANELSNIATWASSGNKSILLTGRGDFSTNVDDARPNQILEAIGSHIRINDDNVYMTGTYQPWYNDLTVIPAASQTAGLTENVSSITLFSPSSLYFTVDGPVLPIIYADHTGYQTDQVPPGIQVVYDDTDDGQYGNQTPLMAIEQVGALRLLVAGTTFFSDFDYGKTDFDNVHVVENFLYWVTNRTQGTIPDVDEVGPRISAVQWTPSSPLNDQPVVFSASVTDPDNVDTVMLEYILDTETVTVPMTQVGGVYSATISGLENKTIAVKVVANDTSGNIATRAYFSLAWAGSTTSTTTTTTTTSAGPVDTLTYVVIIGSVAAVVVVVLTVFARRR